MIEYDIKEMSSVYSHAVHWDKLTALYMNMLVEMNTQCLYLEKAIKMLLLNARQMIALLNVIIAQNIS